MIARSHFDLFPTAPPAREAGGDRPFLLEQGRVWLVLSGRMDVFATGVRDGEPVGRRMHLFRAEAGAPLFGVGERDATGTGLLAVGAAGTTVAEVSLERVREAVSSPDLHLSASDLLHAWIEHLWTAAVDSFRVPQAREAETGGEEVVLESGQCVRPAARVAWMEQVRGASRVLGREGFLLAPGEILPVSDRGWVQGEDGSVLRLLGAEELLASDPDRLWEGLERLNGMALELAGERARAAEESQRERLRVRVATGRATMGTALSRLASTLEGAQQREAGLPLSAGGEDALLAAFRRVAAAQGIELDPTAPGGGEIRARDPVEALARTHRICTRRVALRSGWWEHDNGPLLGWTAEDSRPVALLPGDRGGYVLHDPREGASVPVDAEAAARLASFGTALYRPFPTGPLSFWKVLRFGLHGSRKDLSSLLGTAAAVAVLGLLTPLVIGALFGTIIPGAERGLLLQLTLILLVAAVATSVFQGVRGVTLLRVEARVGAALQAAVWDRLLSLPLSFFRDYSAGDLATRAMGVEEMRRILSGSVITALLSAVFSLSSFALLFYYDAALGGVALLLICTALAASLGISYLQLRRHRAVLQLRSRTSGVVLQLLNGISKLKLAGAEVQAFELWARLFSAQRREQFRARVLGNGLAVFNAVFPVACSIAIFAAAGARLGGTEALGTGEFLGFVAAFSVALTASLSASAAVVGVLSAIPLYEQVQPILAAEPEVHPGKQSPGELSGEIEVQGVTFRYQENGPAVLRDVSFRVRPGEFVAFVGPSGSGKSTILRLLLGFEAPEVGAVSYGPHDLSTLDVQAVRRQVGVVLQDGRIMAGSLFANIVGSSAATLDNAWAAARMAGLEEDIRQMPMGMHTVLVDGGGTLSGGQRQRLMIARALVNLPRVILFDEATSALDNRTQAMVGENLERLNATRVVVAHRLSTVMRADWIYVVNRGSIVESGSYEELLARKGLFYQMAERQLA